VKENAGAHSSQQKALPYQSEEGKGLGSWSFISLSQHTGFPSPAFVHSTSVAHASQRYLFPSCAMVTFTSINNLQNKQDQSVIS
jgi:hypothetical protein